MAASPPEANSGPVGSGSEGELPSLRRELGLFSACMLVVSGIIGSGIFINPYVVAKLLHTPHLILAAWGVGGILAVAGGLVFAELSTVMPKVGGQYAFYREAFHPLVAFLHGWTLLLVIESGAMAAVSVALTSYLLRLTHWPAALGGPLSAGLILALAGYHTLGVKPGAIVVNLLTVVKVAVLAALIAAALLAAPAVSAPPAGWELGGSGLWKAFLSALVPVIFAYNGWQHLNYVAEEVRDPLRNLPRALLFGVALVIVLYLGVNLAYLRALSAPVLAGTRTPAADVAGVVWGEKGARLMSAVIALSMFGSLNLALLSAPRVYYAMAKDGLFFRAIAGVSRRFRVPTAAILLQGVLAAALALSNAFEKLIALSVCGLWLFFALAGAALMVFRRTLPAAPRPFPVPLYPFTPLLFILGSFGIVFSAFLIDAPDALGCLAVIAVGIPAYFLWGRAERGS